MQSDWGKYLWLVAPVANGYQAGHDIEDIISGQAYVTLEEGSCKLCSSDKPRKKLMKPFMMATGKEKKQNT